jgi:uncharacterized membrane protein
MEIKITKKEGLLIDKIFEIGILIKSGFGIFEIMAGIIFAVSRELVLNNIILSFAQQEIADDANDVLANYLIKLVNDFSAGSYLFSVFYLISHGVVNVFIAIALFKNKTWAYGWAIAGFGAFIIYQIYRYFHTYSLVLLSLTIFDIFVVLIIFLEYKRKQKKKIAQ